MAKARLLENSPIAVPTTSSTNSRSPKHLGSKVRDLSLHLSADLIDRSLLLAPLALLGAALTGVFLLAASIVHSPAIEGIQDKVASLILNHSLVAHQHEQQAQGLGKANQDKTDSYC